MKTVLSKANAKYEAVKVMNDDQLYEEAINTIDSNMSQLRKKNIREILMYKADQHITPKNIQQPPQPKETKPTEVIK